MINFANICKLSLFVLFIGSITGCSELKELRGLNQRQSLTIRDQADEISQLKGQNDKLSQELQSDDEEKERLRNELEKLAKAIGEGAIVRDTIEGPVIQLQEKVLFDSGLAEIKKGGKDALLKIAIYLKERQTALLRIDGHTDADPIIKTKHLWDSNHHLSAARALSVFHFLTKIEKIPSEMIHVSGFGSNRPIATNDTKEGKKGNRRVEFLIVKGTESE